MQGSQQCPSPEQAYLSDDAIDGKKVLCCLLVNDEMKLDLLPVNYTVLNNAQSVARLHLCQQ